MKAYERRANRRKRDHKVKCLKCDLVFLSEDLKVNRICGKCKSNYDWYLGPDYEAPSSSEN